ncbi:hypothetical protein BS47DRAFT_1347433 [Hydnum rufescens UP504]|uniref:Bromo domain-containing protein n=1 Tax=Hydnum rufescens UP504 TaxID=1448309 RepID=A0A9P6ASE8_9AGAM|nr:hypothetical protein BS47DRAFT_1347433 [Hydnum rufescens UP504]
MEVEPPPQDTRSPEQWLDSTSPEPSADDKREKRKADVAESAELRDKKRVKTTPVPGSGDDEPVQTTVPSSGTRRSRTSLPSSDANAKRFEKVINVLHAAITAQKNGEVFADPVTEAIASDYDEMVVEPMDLRTIKQNIRQGLITNTTEYERAIFLMFANAVMYNLPGSETYDMAKGMISETEKLISEHRATEKFRAH